MAFFSELRQLPWLMLPFDDDKASCDHCGFYSLSEKRVHHLQLPEAKPNQKRCVGSSYGWLALVDWTNPSISLLNPLTRSQIQLPPFTTFPDIPEFRPGKIGVEYVYRSPFNADEDLTMSVKDIPDFYIAKIVLSTDPTKEDCIAMAICGELRHLAFCIVGEDKNCANTWIPLQHQESKTTTYKDVVYWRDQFYAVNRSGGLVLCDLASSTSPPEVKVVFESPASKIDPFAHKYLAVDPVNGELLMILRHIEDCTGKDDEDSFRYRTTKFEVYRLKEEKKDWEKVKGIGNNKVLFLGCNSSMCLCTDNFEKEDEDGRIFKGNSVYFTDDYWEGQTEGKYGGHDLGTFNLEDGTLETLASCSSSDPDPNSASASLIWPPPVWVTPSLP